MGKRTFTRRQVLATTSLGALATITNWPFKSIFITGKDNSKLAILGGKPVRTERWPKWPIWDRKAENDIIDVLRSGKWWRGSGGHVVEFEKQYAELLGAKRCLTTASGTTALLVALHVLGVDAGDEVLVSPYTFIASYNVILLSKALPVFVDTDPETFTMDADKIEERINDRTTAILPVHIYGLPVNMDRVNEIARKHNLRVIEDACQAWLAEYRNKKVGTLGDLGCFSFQNSKHLPTGEGGAIVGDDGEIMDRCHSFHNCGRPFGSVKATTPYPTRGSNRRMQQFQAVMLMSQMKRIQKDADLRLENALYVNSKIEEIPGIIPYKLADGATRSAYHYYPFRYKKEFFNNAPRKKFLEALNAEGIPCWGGYGPQNKYGLIQEALNSRGYKRLFSEERLRRFRKENHLPGNDQLCQEAVCFEQNMLLGNKRDMDDIATAILKIYQNRDKLV
ncbi:MAG: aminotransferase class I/II-fold pyridoxal phosphate-dependent enzyme [Candidatus Neomarinimicrobiota bacterium]